MPVFGQFESTDEFYRHGLGFVARARVISDNDAKWKLVVKVFQPPLRVAGHEAMRAAIDSFLLRSQLQAALAAMSPYWAQVHACGRGPAPEAAFYITDYCPRSLGKLISGRVKMSSGGLYSITNGIIQGLIDLRKTARRPHGGLRPSNVLLTGSDDLARARVLLTDLAPFNSSGAEMETPSPPEDSDLAALGRIIFELVLHRPFNGMQSYPAAASGEWSALGSRGEGWREFCNELLEPSRTEPLSLTAAARRLQTLRVRRSPITPARVTAASAAVASIAVGFSVWKYVGYARDWHQFCAADEQWLYQFQLDLHSDAQRLDRLEKDPALGPAIKAVERDADLDPNRVSGNDTMMLSDLANHPPLSINAFRKTAPALEVIHRVQNALSPEHWPLLRRIDAAKTDFQQRGWTNPAKALAELEDGVRFGPQMVAGIDRLLTSQADLSVDLSNIDDAWESVSVAVKMIHEQASDDKVLMQFEDCARRYAAEAGSHMDNGLGKFGGDLKPLKQVADELDKVLGSDWSARIDRKRFAEESPVYKLAAPLSEAAFHDWLQDEQGYYVFQPAEATAAVNDLNAAADDVQSKIAAVPNNFTGYADAIAALKRQLANVRQQVDSDLANQSWVTNDRQNNTISNRKDAIARQFAEIGREAMQLQAEHTIDQKEWWDAYVASDASVDSPVLRDAWDQWRKRLPTSNRDELPLTNTDFERLRSAAQAWKEALSAADKRLPPPPPLDAPYSTLAATRRERIFLSAVDAAGSEGPPSLDALKAEVDQHADEYAKWCQDIPPLVEAFSHAKAQLDAGYTPQDDPTQTLANLSSLNAHPAWPDVSLQPQPSSVLRRLEALAGVGTLSRQQLAAAAKSPTAPEFALAAWRALSHLTNPAWALNRDELSQEVAIRRNIAACAAQQKDHFREQHLRDELRDTAPALLARFVNAPRPEAELAAAFAEATYAAEEMGVTASTAASPGGASMAVSPWIRYQQFLSAVNVDPMVRYNLVLTALREQAARSPAADRATVARMVDDFRIEVNRLPVNLRGQPAVAGLLARFVTLDEPEPPHGPSAPWQETSSAQGVETFTLNANGSTTTLKFALVQALNAPTATFVCETELSFADFATIAPVRDAGQMRDLLLDYRSDNDPRPGPRVWERNDLGPSGQMVLTQPESWLRPHDDDRWDYPKAFHTQSPFNSSSLDTTFGGNPLHRPRLPMNYLPAPTAMYVAALVGCRLPTSAEWLAADTINQQTGHLPGHLRGSTWRMQQTYIKENGGLPQWPDAGIFWPKGYTGSRLSGPDAQAHELTDSTLFFADTDADGQAPFHNLRGNVAEFIFDNPQASDRARDKSLPALKSFLDQHPDSLFVIGGSALSPPELPVDKPLAVDLIHTEQIPSAWSGYADVGMRLAFPAPRAAGQRLGAILSSADYLLPARSQPPHSQVPQSQAPQTQPVQSRPPQSQPVQIQPPPHISAGPAVKAILAGDRHGQPPAWTMNPLTAEGDAPAEGAVEQRERRAESAAIDALRSEVAALPLTASLTIGDAAKTNPAVARAIERCLSRAQPYKQTYGADGSLAVRSVLDVHELWNELSHLK
jgi:hypothetical protein